MAENAAPMIRPGEIAGWPKLKIVYRTDPDRIVDLLPPGLAPGAHPHVQINVYCVPVQGEPELGISTKVDADYDGMAGQYSLGMGIDQESAIFISRDTNGQPKFPCSIRYFRLGDRVEASAHHQGTTFFEFAGDIGDELPLSGEQVAENEWWVKVSRAVGGVEKQYDFAPHVVRVRSVHEVIHEEAVDGELVLRESRWDPYTELLPMNELVSSTLVSSRFSDREITLAGPLDPDAFWPHVDTIGGSRWPGHHGGPRPTGP